MKGCAAKAIEDIRQFMAKHPDDPEQWFVGMTTNADRQLSDHGVSEGAPCIQCECVDTGEAVDAVDWFMWHGCAGSRWHPDADGTIVYAYLMTDHTKP